MLPIQRCMGMTRRDLLRSTGRAAVFTVASPMINIGHFQLFASTPTEYSTRAIDLLGNSTVADMLSLLTLDWQKLDRWQLDPSTFLEEDFQQLKNSWIDVFHPAVELDREDPYTAARDLFDRWNKFIARQSQYFVRVDDPGDIQQARADGKIAIVLGMQNSSHFRKPEDVGFFHALGQRISQLTYNARNAIGCGCVEQPDDGLTPFGAAIVETMNRCGMIVDLSHAGEQTTLDAFEVSTKPQLITHSNCGAIMRHPRCVSDRVIRAMAKNGSVMGITGIRSFVSRRETVTIEQVLDHYDHVARLAGIEHLGIGSDTGLDGRDTRGRRRGPQLDIAGLNHPKRMFDLTEGLIRRGYSNRSIELVLGRNFERVLKAAAA